MLTGMRKISVLDCTLRDGGLGIEDGTKYNSEIKRFSAQERAQVANLLGNSRIEYIELGAIEATGRDMKGFAIYESIEEVSLSVPENGDAQYAALFRGPDTPIKQIPLRKNVNIDCLRLIVRYSEIEKSLDFCEALCEKGYKVFVQPMVTARYTEDELQLLVERANSMNAHALYFVDSYGYMNGSDVKSFFDKFDSELNPEIKIGFHAHNNMNLAFANAIEILSIESKREIILDTTLLGMGQGAGNLQTELLLPYLSEHFGKNYNYDAVLDACEIIETHTPQSAWGYSLMYLLPAINKVAYKFAADLRNRGLKYKQIYHLLRNIPDEMRHRYTTENGRILYESL